MRVNPSISEQRAMDFYAMDAVKDILMENRHHIKYAKQYQVGVLVVSTGYLSYHALTTKIPSVKDDGSKK